MSDLKVKYPATDSVALTLTLASLASSSTLLGGRESTVVDNTTNLDVDHLLSGNIRVGTTPTTATVIEIWAYAATKVVSGTYTYPDVLDGTDSDETITNNEIKCSALVLLASIPVVSTSSNVDYPFAPVSVAAAFGGNLPPKWGVFLTHNCGAALNSTEASHWLHYTRIQR